MASIGSEHPARSARRRSWQADSRSAIARLRAIIAEDSDSSLTRRLAGTAFIIRVVSALLALLTQIALARWLGSFEFGIYVYAWTWLVLIGGIVDLGLGSAAQRFIPEYTEHRRFALLRGYLGGSRWFVLIVGTAIAAIATGVLTMQPGIAHQTIIPLCLACLALPPFGIAQVQSGISRSYNWVNLGLMPHYVVRQVLLLALLGVLYAFGLRTDAATAMLITVITVWICMLGQLIVLNRRLSRVIERGPKAYAPRQWLATSAPISLVEGFFYLLTSTDVIVLWQFRPPDDVAIYYAAAKMLSLVAFIHFAVSQTVAHKFVEYHVAGDRKRLDAFVADAIRLTFWPSLGLTLVMLALGVPLLRMFGAGFDSGYYPMCLIAIGLLARAAVGPAERLLNMLGERRVCVLIYAGSFAVNLGLCVALIPRFGLAGAAIASASAFTFESGCLFFVAKYRLGFHCLVFGRPRTG